MGRPKQMKDGIRLSFVLSKEQAEHIKKMAIKMSAKEGRQIGVSEAIRMAVEAAYPLPNKQMSFF